MNLSRMRNKGFTLIELMMGLTIMAVVGTVMLKSMSGLQDQSRYNQTVERVNQIKQAIVNVQTINGVPVVTGFVADMGRLPMCLEELLDGTCPETSSWINSNFLGNCLTNGTPPSSTTTTYSTCTTSTPAGKWTPATPSTSNNITSGWNGPYIQTSNDPTTNYAFSDGWGNTVNIPAQDYPTTSFVIKIANQYNNYGWIYQPDTPTVGQVFLQSYGADGKPDDTTTKVGSFEADYPPNQSLNGSITAPYSATAIINNSNSPFFPNPIMTVNFTNAADPAYILEPPSSATSIKGICDITGSTLDSNENCEVSQEMCIILNNQKTGSTLASTTSSGWTGANCNLSIVSSSPLSTSNTSCTSVGGSWDIDPSAPTNHICHLTLTTVPGAPPTYTLPMTTCAAGGLWDSNSSSCKIPSTIDTDLCTHWGGIQHDGVGCVLPQSPITYSITNCPGTWNTSYPNSCTMGIFSNNPVTQLAAIVGISAVTTLKAAGTTPCTGGTCIFPTTTTLNSTSQCSGTTWSTGNAYCSVTGANTPLLQTFCTQGGGLLSGNNTCKMTYMDTLTCQKMGGYPDTIAGGCIITAAAFNGGSPTLDNTCLALNGTVSTLGNGSTDSCTLTQSLTTDITSTSNLCYVFSGTDINSTGYPWNIGSTPYQCTFAAPYINYLNTLCGSQNLPASTSHSCLTTDNICLNVFYRANGDEMVASWPGVTGHNNNSTPTVSFIGKPNLIFDITSSNSIFSLGSSGSFPPLWELPSGQNSISITSDTNGDGCINNAWEGPTYPANRNKIPEFFIPGVPLVFNW